MEFSANLGFLWKERPFLERIAAARAVGFTAVEFHDTAQGEALPDLKDALGSTRVVGLNARMGATSGCAAIPGEEERALAEAAEAIALAHALDAGAVHILSGRTDHRRAERTLVANLSAIARTEPTLTLLIEPICPQAMPGYALSTVEQAADVIAKVGAPNVKILFDCFHVQRASGDVLARFREHVNLIGHVQIAGGLTRQEPDRGELDYRFLLPAFQDAGYQGAFGCEYTPATTVEAGLGWRDAFV